MDYDTTAIADVYDAARGYSETTQNLWKDTITRSVAGHEIRHVLDLGCGTGRYTARLADWFGADVVGVEPSDAMLAVAHQKSASRISFLKGAAEGIPLPDASVDMVFMSMVFHHIGDKAQAAFECQRVLRHRGLLCLRAGTVEQIDAYPYVPFFEDVRSAFEKQLQSKSEITQVLTEGGFDLVRHEVITSEVAPDWDAFAAKISLRADSTLNMISDADFEAGMARLRSHATYGSDGPVTEPIDYFVFQKSSSATEPSSA